MTFDELLDQIVALLQRRGRVTYRALKRRFDLDDAYLEDLKGEILFAHPQARDEDGQGLVWVSDTESTPAFSAPTPQPRQAPDIQDTTSAQAALPPSGLHPSDAERRQLTVMFCDLADSTKLSGQLDPEDLRDMIRVYQGTAAGVIQRYEGYIAQYLGDGLLVYFGWPQAHEDDAQRAVHAALHVLTVMDTLNTRLQQEKGLRLAVRIGIHTGPVVVGEMGGGDRHERLALGETPNIAARLEELAIPATVVISHTTLRLVEGYFTYETLGAHPLKGVATPMPVYRIVGESGARSRLDAAVVRGLTPLVGREQEAGLLLERWGQVQEGRGQVVVLSGEAGIGKSRLLQVLQEHVAGTPHIRLACHSSPYYHQSALYPLIDLLERGLSALPQNASKGKLGALEQIVRQYRLIPEELVPLLANMLSIPVPEGRYPSLHFSPEQQRQKTLEALLTLICAQAAQRPVLFLLEDLHWTDPSTLAWLDLLIEQCPTVPILILLTCRPEFQPPWGTRSYLTPLTVQRFTRAQVETMVQRVTGGTTLPAEVMKHLVDKSDGMPLYVEEMTKAILESGVLHESNGHYVLTGPLTSLTIPMTLQDALMARLDRLGSAKGIAQLGATIGRQFSYALLQAVSPLDDTALHGALARLVDAELVYQRGVPPHATYMFKHALIQDTASQSLLRSTRQQVHRQIAQVLEAQFPEIQKTQPELLAHHYTEAGLSEPAIIWWQRAGETALHQSAFSEAVRHLTQGVNLLHTLAETPERMQRELDMQLLLGDSLGVVYDKSDPQRLRAYTRARTLCERLGNTRQLFEALLGFAYYYQEQGASRHLQETNEQLLALAQAQHDPMLMVRAHNLLGQTLRRLGDLRTARYHLEQAIDLYNLHGHAPATGSAVGSGYLIMSCLHHYATMLHALGHPDAIPASLAQMRQWVQKTPRDQSWFHWFAANLHFQRGDMGTAHEQLDLLMPLATKYDIVVLRHFGMGLLGYVWAAEGQGEAGIALIRQVLASHSARGVTRRMALFNLAGAYLRVNQPEDGLQVMAELFELVLESEEHYSESTLHRLKGELLLRCVDSDVSQAETCFHQALDIARRQQTKSWELRAAMSLARLWQSQGKRQDAHDLLAPIYNWFTEGFDTADLQEAKALLGELVDSPESGTI